MDSKGEQKAKFLFAFDFDDTIIDENSDYYILKLIPQGKPLPDHVNKLYSSSSWTDYMRQIFIYMHEIGITRDQILSCLEEIKFVKGLKDVFAYIKDNGGDIIIISDCNSVFIEHILKHHNLEHMVSVIYTNRACFKHNLLTIQGYHEQDWCTQSTSNLCKGHILLEFIRKANSNGTDYQVVSYIGDGWNDLCPSLKLSAKDLVFPRIGYRLHDELNKNLYDVKATIHPWSSYYDVIKHFSETLLNQ